MPLAFTAPPLPPNQPGASANSYCSGVEPRSRFSLERQAEHARPSPDSRGAQRCRWCFSSQVHHLRQSGKKAATKTNSGHCRSDSFETRLRCLLCRASTHPRRALHRVCLGRQARQCNWSREPDAIVHFHHPTPQPRRLQHRTRSAQPRCQPRTTHRRSQVDRHPPQHACSRFAEDVRSAPAKSSVTRPALRPDDMLIQRLLLRLSRNESR